MHTGHASEWPSGGHDENIPLHLTYSNGGTGSMIQLCSNCYRERSEGYGRPFQVARNSRTQMSQLQLHICTNYNSTNVPISVTVAWVTSTIVSVASGKTNGGGWDWSPDALCLLFSKKTNSIIQNITKENRQLHNNKNLYDSSGKIPKLIVHGFSNCGSSRPTSWSQNLPSGSQERYLQKHYHGHDQW